MISTLKQIKWTDRLGRCHLNPKHSTISTLIQAKGLIDWEELDGTLLSCTAGHCCHVDVGMPAAGDRQNPKP